MKGLSDSHPIVAAAYFVALLIVAMFVWNPVVQLLAMVGGIFYCLSLHGAGKTLRDLGFFLPFFLLIALTNPLFPPKAVPPSYAGCGGWRSPWRLCFTASGWR